MPPSVRVRTLPPCTSTTCMAPATGATAVSLACALASASPIVKMEMEARKAVFTQADRYLRAAAWREKPLCEHTMISCSDR